MDINRNQFFLAGLVIFFLGVQFRLIDSVTFTPQFTRLLSEASGAPVAVASDTSSSLLGTSAPMSSKTVRPPEWLGWSLLSAGSVLILHALSLRKPSG